MSEMRAMHTPSSELTREQYSRSAAIRHTPRLGTALFDALFAAVAALLILLALAARNGVEATIAARTGDLGARAVLREDMTEEQARAVADQLEREEPGLKTRVIGPVEARSRLALQESWMRHLPEVELAELPTVLEVRHPLLLSDPNQVLAFHSRLESRPEVQFLQFNAIGYDALVRFAAEARRIAGRIAWAVIASVIVLYTMFAIARRRRRRQGAGSGVLSSGSGALIGATALSAALTAGLQLPSAGMGTLAAVVGGAVLLRLLGNWAGSLLSA